MKKNETETVHPCDRCKSVGENGECIFRDDPDVLTGTEQWGLILISATMLARTIKNDTQKITY